MAFRIEVEQTDSGLWRAVCPFGLVCARSLDDLRVSVRDVAAEVARAALENGLKRGL